MIRISNQFNQLQNLKPRLKNKDNLKTCQQNNDKVNKDKRLKG
jgi:hypothetical protein